MPSHYPTSCLVLLVEDETIIAMTLEDDLRDAGYEVAGPFSTCADALGWLKSHTPDSAVLDTMLKDGTCKDLALQLNDRGIPFVIYSGHPEDKNTLSEFMDAIWIGKPAPHRRIIEALAKVLSGRLRQEG